MTTASPVVNVDVERTFNHDLLVCKGDQDRAARRWPLLAHVLIDHELIREFKPHEERAKALKRRVQLIGSAAVVLMLGGGIHRVQLKCRRRSNSPRFDSR